MDLIVSIYNTSTYPLKSVLLTASGISITCNGVTVNNVNTNTFSSITEDIITLTVTKTGYKTYSNTFAKYQIEDLTLKIFLEPEVLNSADPDYLRVYPNF